MMVSVGDVVEIHTSNGLAYVQCSQDHPRYGHLVRVLPGFHEATPLDLQRLVYGKESLIVFFHLHAAVKVGLFKIVASCSVPERVRDLRVFRTGFQDQATKTVKEWWFWDGKSEWRLRQVSNREQEIPIPEVWFPGLLVEDIENGWTPDRDLSHWGAEKTRTVDGAVGRDSRRKSARSSLQPV
jgi:hypothetical protein